jgi:hypothetical protein
MTLLSVQLQGHIHKVAKLRLKFLLSRKNRGKLEKGKKKKPVVNREATHEFTCQY